MVSLITISCYHYKTIVIKLFLAASKINYFLTDLKINYFLADLAINYFPADFKINYLMPHFKIYYVSAIKSFIILRIFFFFFEITRT